MVSVSNAQNLYSFKSSLNRADVATVQVRGLNVRKKTKTCVKKSRNHYLLLALRITQTHSRLLLPTWARSLPARVHKTYGAKETARHRFYMFAENCKNRLIYWLKFKKWFEMKLIETKTVNLTVFMVYRSVSVDYWPILYIKPSLCKLTDFVIHCSVLRFSNFLNCIQQPDHNSFFKPNTFSQFCNLAPSCPAPNCLDLGRSLRGDTGHRADSNNALHFWEAKAHMPCINS